MRMTKEQKAIVAAEKQRQAERDQELYRAAYPDRVAKYREICAKVGVYYDIEIDEKLVPSFKIQACNHTVSAGNTHYILDIAHDLTVETPEWEFELIMKSFNELIDRRVQYQKDLVDAKAFKDSLTKDQLYLMTLFNKVQ